MDVKNIIKRMQDIDKLKLVLFDDNQRKVFEVLPKPGIMFEKKRVRSSILTVEQIKNWKTIRYNPKSCQRLEFLLNGDPMNNRMLQMIEANFNFEIGAVKKGKLHLIY